jgi:putative sigma-54 modulation protein
MRIHIRGRSLNVSDEQGAHIERRLIFALGRFGEEVDSVEVSVEDVNGPRGGIDKCCRMAVRLTSGGAVRVEEVGEALEGVVDGAADRMSRSVARALKRGREFRIR